MKTKKPPTLGKVIDKCRALLDSQAARITILRATDERRIQTWLGELPKGEQDMARRALCIGDVVDCDFEATDG